MQCYVNGDLFLFVVVFFIWLNWFNFKNSDTRCVINITVLIILLFGMLLYDTYTGPDFQKLTFCEVSKDGVN